MSDASDLFALPAALRALATAAKSLRLYPATSPIPRESVEAALTALGEFFANTEPRLVLSVGREGLSWQGQLVQIGSVSMADLMQSVHDHGVAKIEVTDGVSAEELIGFLALLGESPDAIRSRGGLGKALVETGIRAIALEEVVLVVADAGDVPIFEDTDDFLRELINDPQRLAAWFNAAAAGDPSTFSESLMELLRVAGPSGYQGLLGGLANAFAGGPPDARDGLLSLALDRGPVQDLTGDMFSFLSSPEIAGSVLGGVFGRNMLSLSNALSKLPLDKITAEVRAEVQAMLPNLGHSADEASFLNHMIEVREAPAAEPTLAEADRSYQAVVDVANLPEDTVDKARSAVIGSAKVLSAVGVRTMLVLLDQQEDFNLYCRTAESLASMVPRLIAQGDLALAASILTELSNRERLTSSPWPDLSQRMAAIRGRAAGPETMQVLLKEVSADESLLEDARTIVGHAGNEGIRTLVAEAIPLKTDGLRVAEQLVGRRMLDSLYDLALRAEWFQLAPIVARLIVEDDSRSTATIEALMRRPDAQSRREVVMAAAAADGSHADHLCIRALNDPAAEVAIAATRALSRSGDPAVASAIVKRLGALDLDSADYAVAREMIVALTHLPGAEADHALAKIAGRRTLIKRGHFGEVQDLVAKIQRLRAEAAQA